MPNYQNAGNGPRDKYNNGDPIVTCDKHKDILSGMGYLQAHAKAEELLKAGEKQHRCVTCKRYFFDCELSI